MSDLETSRKIALTRKPTKKVTNTIMNKFRNKTLVFSEGNSVSGTPEENYENDGIYEDVTKKKPDPFLNIMKEKFGVISDAIYESLYASQTKRRPSKTIIKDELIDNSEPPGTRFNKVEDNNCNSSESSIWEQEDLHGDYVINSESVEDPCAFTYDSHNTSLKKFNNEHVDVSGSSVEIKNKFVLKNRSALTNNTIDISRLNDNMNESSAYNYETKYEMNSNNITTGLNNDSNQNSSYQIMAFFHRYNHLPPREDSNTFGIKVSNDYEIKRKNTELIFKGVETELEIGDSVKVIDITPLSYFCNVIILRLSKHHYIPLEYISDEFFAYITDFKISLYDQPNEL